MVQTTSSKLKYLLDNKIHWLYYEQNQVITITTTNIHYKPTTITLCPCIETSEKESISTEDYNTKPKFYYIERQYYTTSEINYRIIYKTERYLYQNNIFYQMTCENNILTCHKIDKSDVPWSIQNEIFLRTTNHWK